MTSQFKPEEFEDTKEVIRIRKSKDRQGQKKKDKQLHGKCSTTSEYLFCGARETVPYEAQFYSCLYDIVKKTLKELKYHRLIPNYENDEEKIMTFLQDAVQTEANLTMRLSQGGIDNKTMQEIEKEISAIISQEPVALMLNAFATETYQRKIRTPLSYVSTDQVDSSAYELQPEKTLNTADDKKSAVMLLWANVVIDIFVIVLRCVGISIDLDETHIKILVKTVEELVRKSEFQRALERFLEAWNNAGDRAWEKAKVIFRFLEIMHILGYFWVIIELILKNMSTWDKTKAILEVGLVINVAFCSAGAALVGRIAVAARKAVNLAKKIVKIIELLDQLINGD